MNDNKGKKKKKDHFLETPSTALWLTDIHTPMNVNFSQFVIIKTCFFFKNNRYKPIWIKKDENTLGIKEIMVIALI